MATMLLESLTDCDTLVNSTYTGDAAAIWLALSSTP